jgi:SAM-dependent methyltransferase
VLQATVGAEVCRAPYHELMVLSPAMLAIARRQASQLDHPVELREADADALPFPDASSDTLVCTFSLCAIPDERGAIAEMYRVLRPSGHLLLADHVAASTWPVRAVQRLLRVVTIPTGGEHFLSPGVRRASGMAIVAGTLATLIGEASGVQDEATVGCGVVADTDADGRR